MLVRRCTRARGDAAGGRISLTRALAGRPRGRGYRWSSRPNPPHAALVRGAVIDVIVGRVDLDRPAVNARPEPQGSPSELH
jgi:hypothetical protein